MTLAPTAADLAAMTPPDVDSRLADLYDQHAKAFIRFGSAVERAHHAIGERQIGHGRNKHWPTSDESALARCAEIANPDVVYGKAADAHRAITQAGEARAEMDRLTEVMTPYEAEFGRRRWSRFFIVTSSDGHIHRDRACSTCRITTEYGWLPQLSGLTEADAVKAHGPLLCSVCYPTAPVEWTLGRPKPQGCAGTGESPVEGTAKRYGMRTYAECPECHERELLTSSGAIRKHKPKKADN